MSYDLTLFAVVPGEDPEETVDELVEAFDAEIPPNELPAAVKRVAALVAALRAELPEAEVETRRDGTQALVSVGDGAFTVDVLHDHCDICISYAGSLDDHVGLIARAQAATTAAAGFSALYDHQSGDVQEGRVDEDAVRAGFAEVDAVVRDMADDLDGAPKSGGRLRRLFGRG